MPTRTYRYLSIWTHVNKELGGSAGCFLSLCNPGRRFKSRRGLVIFFSCAIYLHVFLHHTAYVVSESCINGAFGQSFCSLQYNVKALLYSNNRTGQLLRWLKVPKYNKNESKKDTLLLLFVTYQYH